MKSADRQETAVAKNKSEHLKEKIKNLKGEIKRLKKLGVRMQEAPDQQISETDPDARSMATSGRGTGMVGYKVQTAVDRAHHLIAAHDVTNEGSFIEEGNFPTPLVTRAVLGYFAFRFQATRAATAAPTLNRANWDGSGTGASANAAAGTKNNNAARMIENLI